MRLKGDLFTLVDHQGWDSGSFFVFCFVFKKCPVTFIGSQVHRKETKASKEVKVVWKPYTDFWLKDKRTNLMIYGFGN